jgi:beta-lactamase class A
MTRSTPVVLTAAVALVIPPAPAHASRPTLSNLIGTHLPVVESAAAAARSGDPTAVQARYDAARDVQTALVGRAAPSCPVLLQQLARYADANVRAAEAFDRVRATAISRLDAAAKALAAGLRRSRRSCADGRLVRTIAVPPHRDAARRAAAVLAGEPIPRDPSTDGALAAKLHAVAAGFSGEAAVWVHDLRTGRAAGVGADDRYPAASTVKLGVLVAAIARYGVTAAVAHDLAAMSSWSSNLAANRLWRLVGGDAAVEATLRRLGAAASTYPGPYRAGTSRSAPPLVSRRVTTARDLGRVLARLHGAALGRRADLRAAQLTQYEARVALGLLMAGDDREGALVPPVPAAQKHGWLRSARHTAAILYGSHGPVVAVLLLYREGIRADAAQRLGRRVAAIALRVA